MQRLFQTTLARLWLTMPAISLWLTNSGLAQTQPVVAGLQVPYITLIKGSNASAVQQVFGGKYQVQRMTGTKLPTRLTNRTSTVAANPSARATAIEIANFYQGGDGTNWQPSFQRAIQQGLADGGIKVHVPPGIYGFNSGFTAMTNINSGNCWAQLLLPVIDIYSNGGPAITIEFDGDVAPSFSPNWTTNQTRLPSYGAIIVTTNVPPDYPACQIGFPVPLTTSFGESAVNLVLNDLLFQTYANPGMDCINLAHASASSTLNNIEIDAAPMWTLLSAPTGEVNGVVMPGINNFLPVSALNVSVSGYPNGIIVGEHSTSDNLMTWRCNRGIVVPDMFQNFTIRNATVVACHTDLWCSATSGSSIIDANIMNFDFEHPNGASGMPAWTTCTKSIADPNGFLRGSIIFGGVNTGGTVGDLVNPDISTNLSIYSLYSPDVRVLHRAGNGNYGPLDLGGVATDPSRANPGLSSLINGAFGKLLIVQGGLDAIAFDNIKSSLRYGVFSNWNWFANGNFTVVSNFTAGPTTIAGGLTQILGTTNGTPMIISQVEIFTNVGTSFPTLTFNTNGLGTTGGATYSGAQTNDNIVVVTFTTGTVGLNAVPIFTNTFAGAYSRPAIVDPFPISPHAAQEYAAHAFYTFGTNSYFTFAPSAVLSTGVTDTWGFRIYH
jgi:hypothetical protein